MAHTPGPPTGNQPRRDDVLVVKGVGEKRTPGQWAILIGIPGLLVVVGVVVVLALTHTGPQVNVQSRATQQTPGAPQAGAPTSEQPQTGAPTATSPAGTPGATTVPDTGGTTPSPAPTTSAGAAANVSGAAVWEGFRGPGRMNISGESLARTFPSGGPRRLWQVSLGEGHAGAAVYKGRVYVLDYNAGSRRDELKCLDLSSGKQLWSQGYNVDIKSNHGMSRTVPAVDGNYVVTLGPMGQVMCCDANSGKMVWKKDLVAEYGTRVPTWYAGQCPLIENNNAIIAPGGKALMVALHLPTGKVTWSTPNPRGWQMTHSSIMPVQFGGKRIYVYPASGGVVGVNARNGQLLWSTPEWTVNTANVPTAVPLGSDGRIFVCGGYNSGAAILQMGSGGSSVSMVKRIRPNVFQSHQQTPILYQGHLYGVRMPGDLVCLDLNGNVVWSSGNTARFGIGPYVMANGVLYVLGDTGDLAIVEANPSGYKQLAKAKVLTGADAWAPLAVADGKLICRDSRTMVCLDMRR